MKRTQGDIKKKLNKMGANAQIVEFVFHQIQLRDERIEAQSKALEINNRETLTIDRRFLVLETVESSNSKITINPCDGRVQLKVSHQCSDKVKGEMNLLAWKVMNDSNLPPVTMRGKIKFDDGKYKVCLMSESKRYSKNYELEVE